MVSLHRRMMYFCNLAYSRKKVVGDVNGSWTARDNAIGLVGPLRRVGRNYSANGETGDTFARDIAVVGRTSEAIVVAFRGTQPPSPNASRSETQSIINDWLNDASVFGRADHNFFEGIVHDGFSDAAVALLNGDDGVAARIDALRSVADAPQRLVLTGHSKGGALAIFAAYWLVRHHGLAAGNLQVVTFGGARCGDNAFCNAYKALGIPTKRYESDTDIVPLLPAGSDVPPIVSQAARLLGYSRANGATGFMPCGARSPNVVPGIEAWFGAYSGLLLAFAVNPGALFNKLVWSHGIIENQAYDAIVG